MLINSPQWLDIKNKIPSLAIILVQFKVTFVTINNNISEITEDDQKTENISFVLTRHTYYTAIVTILYSFGHTAKPLSRYKDYNSLNHLFP